LKNDFYFLIYVKIITKMILDLSHKRLTSLDGIDLSGVTVLNCHDNQLTSLLSLPPSLERLDCSSNKLTSLPPLPSTLKKLYCYDNLLTSLPDLPFTLKELYCPNNQLTSLPDLPALKELYCHTNQLTSLPPLPSSLKELYCYDNLLTEYPDLPWGLKHWNKDWDNSKLNQHNKKRIDLGMDTVKTLPTKKIWDEVAEKHLIWQYRIGGEKWSKACSSLVEK